MAGAVSRWLGAVEDLSLIAQRLLRVQIEHGPAIEVIKRYDSEETLFYCDPPYPHGSRGDSHAYANEMTDEQHRELAEILRNVKGKVALSSYHCKLMDELYGDWQRIESKEKIIHSVKTKRKEVLWINYELEEKAVCQSSDRSHRIRMQFLEAYQSLLMGEPDSAVSPSLKEAFLSLRLATETGITQPIEDQI